MKRTRALASFLSLSFYSLSRARDRSHVFLASLLLMPTCATCVKDCAPDFNALVPAIVRDYQSRGRRISYVPLAEATGMCADAGAADAGLCVSAQVHPVSAGYLRMASAFAFAIMQEWRPPARRGS